MNGKGHDELIDLLRIKRFGAFEWDELPYGVTGRSGRVPEGPKRNGSRDLESGLLAGHTRSPSYRYERECDEKTIS